MSEKYCPEVDIQNFEEVQGKIESWKTDVLTEVKKTSKNITLYFTVSVLFLLIGLGFFLWFIIEIARPEQDFLLMFIFFIVIAIVFFGLSGLLLFLGIRHRRKAFKAAIENQKINPYTEWLEDINKYFVDKSTLTDNQSRFIDYSRLKYNLSGRKDIGLKREYEIISGKIFDNPYSLSCGVWESRTVISHVQGTYKTYMDYLPLIKVKTNLFAGETFSITNSKDFGNFNKKDIKVESDDFNNKFSIMGSNENDMRMIITPLVQNKWLDMKDLNPFNISIQNGYIDVLFKPKDAFMDQTLLKNKTIKGFSKIDKLIWNDISLFLSMLTLIFSISIFQFEEN